MTHCSLLAKFSFFQGEQNLNLVKKEKPESIWKK